MAKDEGDKNIWFCISHFVFPDAINMKYQRLFLEYEK